MGGPTRAQRSRAAPSNPIRFPRLLTGLYNAPNPPNNSMLTMRACNWAGCHHDTKSVWSQQQYSAASWVPSRRLGTHYIRLLHAATASQQQQLRPWLQSAESVWHGLHLRTLPRSCISTAQVHCHPSQSTRIPVPAALHHMLVELCKAGCPSQAPPHARPQKHPR